MLFLISYKFSDAAAQEKGAKMLIEWYDKGGPQNSPRIMSSNLGFSYPNMETVTLW